MWILFHHFCPRGSPKRCSDSKTKDKSNRAESRGRGGLVGTESRVGGTASEREQRLRGAASNRESTEGGQQIAEDRA